MELFYVFKSDNLYYIISNTLKKLKDQHFHVGKDKLYWSLYVLPTNPGKIKWKYLKF